MQRFEINETPAGLRLTAIGSTRAGLAIASIMGLFSIQHPSEVTSEASAQEHERLFALSGANFGELLGKLLSGALVESVKNGETYNHFRFDLITDREAKGAYVGRVAALATPIKGVRVAEGSVTKREDGTWGAELIIDE
ncbi:MAG: hypothetical protein AAB974_02020 [Patescibacteria group bacterium]